MYLKTELIEIKLIGMGEFNDYEFIVLVLNTGEEFCMSYSTDTNSISCLYLSEVPTRDNNNILISSKTGRPTDDSYKDIEGPMDFYIKEIMQFLIRLNID